jgi:hypothetical protein
MGGGGGGGGPRRSLRVFVAQMDGAAIAAHKNRCKMKFELYVAFEKSFLQ